MEITCGVIFYDVLGHDAVVVVHNKLVLSGDVALVTNTTTAYYNDDDGKTHQEW